jgi:hypothetical protein
MMVAMCDEFLEIYLQIGRERGIPSFMRRDHGNSPEEREWFRRRAAEWENQGQPVFDHCRVVTRSGDAEDHLDSVSDVFDRLPAGLSCVLLHPAIDTLEIRSSTSDWRGRVADFDVFRQPYDLGTSLRTSQVRPKVRRHLGIVVRPPMPHRVALDVLVQMWLKKRPIFPSQSTRRC